MTRTENDTWDLATSVGATATMVAAGRARASKAANPLIDDPFAEPLVRGVGVDFLTRWATGELAAADVDAPDAGWGMQRMTNLLAARTRYFDAFFVDAMNAGLRQAVILASGLDARGYRLWWPAGMTVFEIDQPQVVAFKTATLADLGAEPTTDLRTVPIDLRNDWPAALRREGFDPGRPTAWIAEGLLGFLPPEAQDRLLDNITALSADGSRLATETFANATAVDSAPAEARAEEAVRKATERWREHGFDVEIADLGFPGERNNVAEYLGGQGWRSVSTTMAELLAANALPTPPQNGDTESWPDSYYYTSVLTK
jgi:methyltransferase (TIGR00027 family)